VDKPLCDLPTCPHGATTTTDCRRWFPHETTRGQNSSLSYAILRGLVQRLRAADRQIESLALLDVYGRVARALLDMADEDAGEKVIRGKVSRQDLAKHVGASREMVSRVMKDLEERGLIETQETGSVVLKERLSNTA